MTVPCDGEMELKEAPSAPIDFRDDFKDEAEVYIADGHYRY